jgi:integrase
VPYPHYGKWRARWNDENGKQRSATFPDFKSADFFEKRKKIEAQEIRRGLRSPLPPDRTFADLAEFWFARRAAAKRSGPDIRCILDRHLVPFFGAMRVRDVGVEDLDEYTADKLEKLSAKTIANHVTVLVSMFNYAAALKQPWVLSVPKFKKPKVTHGRDFNFLRTEDEIQRFLGAARAEGHLVHAFYATALYTGARAGEIAALEWTDIDFDRRLITIQRSFSGPTKSDRVRYVPILDPLLPILREWRLRHPGRLVFTTRDGTMHGESARIFQEILHRVLDSAGFPRVTRTGKSRPYIRFHDLRHTFASHWVMRDGSLFKLQKILGHQSVTMTERYSHLQPSAFAEDYARLGDAGLVRPADVVALVRVGE